METSIDQHVQTAQKDCTDVLRTFFNISASDAEKFSEILVQKGQVCLPGFYTEDLAITRIANMNEAIKQGLYPYVTLGAYAA